MTDKTSGPAVSGSTAPARAAETAAPDFQDLVAPVPDAVRKESVAVGVSRAPSAGARWSSPVLPCSSSLGWARGFSPPR